VTSRAAAAVRATAARWRARWAGRLIISRLRRIDDSYWIDDPYRQSSGLRLARVSLLGST
jgi:hypothetical protein